MAAATAMRLSPLRVATRSQPLSLPLIRAAYLTSKPQPSWRRMPSRAFSHQRCRTCVHTINQIDAPSDKHANPAPLVLEKKYTEDHEWIELSPDGKIGKPALHVPPCLPPTVPPPKNPSFHPANPNRHNRHHALRLALPRRHRLHRAPGHRPGGAQRRHDRRGRKRQVGLGHHDDSTSGATD